MENLMLLGTAPNSASEFGKKKPPIRQRPIGVTRHSMLRPEPNHKTIVRFSVYR
jgi:hypothetical protein